LPVEPKVVWGFSGSVICSAAGQLSTRHVDTIVKQLIEQQFDIYRANFNIVRRPRQVIVQAL